MTEDNIPSTDGKKKLLLYILSEYVKNLQKKN